MFQVVLPTAQIQMQLLLESVSRRVLISTEADENSERVPRQPVGRMASLARGRAGAVRLVCLGDEGLLVPTQGYPWVSQPAIHCGD